MPTVHDLREMCAGDAYDATQCDDAIKDGDVLLTREGVALLMSAWPVMIVGSSSTFHSINVTWDEVNAAGGRYTDSLLIAYAIAFG